MKKLTEREQLAVDLLTANQICIDHVQRRLWLRLLDGRVESVFMVVEALADGLRRAEQALSNSSHQGASSQESNGG